MTVTDQAFIDLQRQFKDLEKRLDTLMTQGTPGQSVNSAASVSSGTGTVKMNGATNRNNTGWVLLKDQGGNSIYVPYWTVITG